MKKKLTIISVVAAVLASTLASAQQAVGDFMNQGILGGLEKALGTTIGSILSIMIPIPTVWGAVYDTPLWALIAVFILLQAMWIALVRYIPFFKDDEVKNQRKWFAVGLSFITLFATPVIQIFLTLFAGYITSSLMIIMVLLFVCLLWFVFATFFKGTAGAIAGANKPADAKITDYYVQRQDNKKRKAEAKKVGQQAKDLRRLIKDQDKTVDRIAGRPGFWNSLNPANWVSRRRRKGVTAVNVENTKELIREIDFLIKTLSSISRADPGSEESNQLLQNAQNHLRNLFSSVRANQVETKNRLNTLLGQLNKDELGITEDIKSEEDLVKAIEKMAQGHLKTKNLQTSDEAEAGVLENKFKNIVEADKRALLEDFRAMNTAVQRLKKDLESILAAEFDSVDLIDQIQLALSQNKYPQVVNLLAELKRIKLKELDIDESIRQHADARRYAADRLGRLNNKLEDDLERLIQAESLSDDATSNSRNDLEDLRTNVKM